MEFKEILSILEYQINSIRLSNNSKSENNYLDEYWQNRIKEINNTTQKLEIDIVDEKGKYKNFYTLLEEINIKYNRKEIEE